MHSNSSAELQSLQICQDDKFLSKLLSRERSITGSSGRAAYYTGISGSVPFTWETQPGTPRTLTVSCNKQLETPPLTPPPAYYTTDDQAAGRRISSSSRSSRLLKTLFSHSKDAGSWDNAAVQRTSSTESVSSYSSSFSGKRESGRISSSCSGSMTSSSIIFDEKKVDVLDHAIMEKLVLTRESSPSTYVTCFGMKKIRSQGRKGDKVCGEKGFLVSRLCVI
ncbi:unnamed protein product [Rhodiola kirilowii]